MQTQTEIKSLLEQYGLAPRKSLGQNFLCDHNLIRKLVASAQVGPGCLVLEVGPGTGALTEELLASGARVVACELDRGLAALLRDRFASEISAGSLTLIEGDCLDGKHHLNPAIEESLGASDFKLVSNLPYGAATPLILTLVADHPRCTALYVTIQREVAQRLRARPGSKEYGVISVIVQALCDIHRIALAPPDCFWPRPKVVSELIGFSRKSAALNVPPAHLVRVSTLLFAHRRKQIRSALGTDIELPEGVLPSARAEQLTVQQFIEIAQHVPE